jgi:hypothetical protein
VANQSHDPSRRRVAAALALLPLALAGLAGAAQAQTCYDPNTLPLSQRSRRRSIGFKDVSPDPAKRCAICAFFTATGASGCGTCRMLTGGVVGANGVCNSFAKKA